VMDRISADCCADVDVVVVVVVVVEESGEP
jgi:hypothetical protein